MCKQTIFVQVVYIDSYLQWCYNLQTEQNFMLVLASQLYVNITVEAIIHFFQVFIINIIFPFFFYSLAECQEDDCSRHNWPWGTWDVSHRGGGDRSLCQSYDDSQSGLGFTSNLLNLLENSYRFFFSVSFVQTQ